LFSRKKKLTIKNKQKKKKNKRKKNSIPVVLLDVQFHPFFFLEPLCDVGSMNRYFLASTQQLESLQTTRYEISSENQTKSSTKFREKYTTLGLYQMA
jgi:hypothetical protein